LDMLYGCCQSPPVITAKKLITAQQHKLPVFFKHSLIQRLGLVCRVVFNGTDGAESDTAVGAEIAHWVFTMLCTEHCIYGACVTDGNKLVC